MCQTKVCTKCEKEKITTSFRERPSLKCGYHSWCRDCENEANRKRVVKKVKEVVVKTDVQIKEEEQLKKYKAKERMLKYRYSLTIDSYHSMYEEQNKSCKICLKEYELGGWKGLYVDHCHRTGKVRGLLCPKCNTMIGVLNEDIELLRSMAKYIEDNL